MSDTRRPQQQPETPKRGEAAAWQTVFHFHVHVIPRYEGDPLRLPWTPESGDEEEIAAAADDLRG